MSQEPIEVTILSREGCHLCEVVAKMARRLQQDLPCRIREIDIAADTALLARYGNRVPVVLIEQVEALAGKVMERDLRQAIKKARWRRPVSRILSRLRETLKRG